MTDMVCTYSGKRDETLVAYLYNDIAAAEREAFESHLAACPACREELAALGDVRADMGTWQPPAFSLQAPGAGHQSSVASQQPAASSQSPAGEARSFWADVPVWAQTLAAMLVLGVAAGAANLNVHRDANGLVIRTGWMAAQAVSSAQSADAPWRAELTKLESELRNEHEAEARAVADKMSQSAVAPARPSTPDAELLRQVKALIEQSEKKEQNELALRIAQVVRESQAERNADLMKIDRFLGLLQNNATFEVARNREMINTLARQVSQTVR